MINVGEKAEVGAGVCLLALIGVCKQCCFSRRNCRLFFSLIYGFFSEVSYKLVCIVLYSFERYYCEVDLVLFPPIAMFIFSKRSKVSGRPSRDSILRTLLIL